MMITIRVVIIIDGGLRKCDFRLKIILFFIFGNSVDDAIIFKRGRN